MTSCTIRHIVVHGQFVLYVPSHRTESFGMAKEYAEFKHSFRSESRMKLGILKIQTNNKHIHNKYLMPTQLPGGFMLVGIKTNSRSPCSDQSSSTFQAIHPNHAPHRHMSSTFPGWHRWAGSGGEQLEVSLSKDIYYWGWFLHPKNGVINMRKNDPPSSCKKLHGSHIYWVMHASCNSKVFRVTFQ